MTRICIVFGVLVLSSLPWGCRSDPDDDRDGDPGDAGGDADEDSLPPPRPGINVSPTELDFDDEGTSLDFEVWLHGEGTMAYTIAESTSWLEVSGTGGESSGERDAFTATVDRAGMAFGEHRGEIVVSPSEGEPLSIVAVMTVPAPEGDPMTTASRDHGVAPLAVYFDATEASSGVVQPADGRHAFLAHRWDFGDPDSGSWETDGLSRNRADGFAAGHVFERPGAYRVTLQVDEPDGTTHSYHQDITVTDPDEDGWTTYYVASDGSDSDDGQSESSAFQSVRRALQDLGPNVRVLFRRGDTFAVSSQIDLDIDGPAIVGAFGSGDAPVLSFTSAVGRGFQVGFRGTNRDIRFTDLTIEGPGGETIAFFAEAADLHQALFYRVRMTDWGRGLVLSGYEDTFSECAVVDSTFDRINGHWGVYFGGRRSMILGSSLSNPGGSHTLRVWYAQGLVIGHNVLRDGGEHTLKFHAIDYTGDGTVSRDIVISHNDFGGAGPWTVAIGPQNQDYDERVERVLYESNVHRSSYETQVALYLWARDVVVRNNVFIGDGASPWHTAVQIDQRGQEPPPQDNFVLHNTIYRGDRGGDATGVQIASVASTTTVRNNLMSAPGGTATMIAGSGSGLVQDHNLSSSDPGFTDPGEGDFALGAGSPAIDSGVDVDCPYDFSGQPRFDDPSTENTGEGTIDYSDLGAFEYRP